MIVSNGAPDASPPASPRVLLCGVGPLPLGDPDRLYAPGLRVWGFAHALAETGCRVDLLEARFGQAASGGEANLHRLGSAAGEATALARVAGRAEVARPVAGGVTFQGIPVETIPLSPAEPVNLVARQLRTQSYGAVLSTTDVMNDACARACGSLPLWCDFFGHPMAERQSMAAVHDSDEGLAAQWDYVIAPLLRADRLSGCSDAQRLAILGEMGACGRLNRFTDGCEPVVSLPPAAVLQDFEAGGGNAFRGVTVPRDAFVVLWSGGYNTWADVETLAAALIEAMRCEPAIYFVSTGGVIAGHDERTFVRFREKIAASPVARRCHFAGWVPTRDVPSYYLESDVGLNCERRKLEGELGTRNRILDWICARLPVISTSVCELTRDLSARGFIDAFEPGDVSGLAGLLVRAARRSKEAARTRAEEARAYVLESYSPSRLFKPMCEWALRPERAPDLKAGAARLPGVPFEIPDNPLARRRAEEWRDARERAIAAPEVCCPVSAFLGRVVRRLTR